jgi:hypothetical protein
MEPLLLWSSVLGLVLGLSLILLRSAAMKLHEHALRDSRWRHVAAVLALGRYIVAVAYSLGYPQLLKVALSCGLDILRVASSVSTGCGELRRWSRHRTRLLFMANQMAPRIPNRALIGVVEVRVRRSPSSY